MKTQYSIRRFTFLLLVTIFMIGCQTKTSKKTENDIQFNKLEVEKIYHLLENKDNPNCNLVLSFTYPEKYANAAILEKIQTLFISSYFGEAYEGFTPQEAINRYTEDYLEAYKDLEEDFKEELKKADEFPVGSWYSYYESASNEVTFNMNDILSYTVYFENYTGGAHNAHSLTNHVINLKTGEFINEKDIFVEGFENALAQLLVEKIAEQNEVENTKALENIGFFSIDEIYPNGNFLVDDEGITYAFNEYEIAAYVVGITHVQLPYSNILHLLKKESPISHLLAK